jgi:drug/metabolite transporter (DMT)-like permease
MNTANDSKLNDILVALGIMVLVLGTATGNAYVMFAMAVAAIAAVAIFGRRAISWRAWFGAMVAAVTAVAVVFGLAKF